MFQGFDASTSPEQGPPRLGALRRQMAADGLDGFLVPRADAHQGEYVAACDDRLAWLTGFTGSAGFCVVLQEVAGVFVDGRYRVQVKAQVATDFTAVNWPDTKLGPWLAEKLPHGGKVGFDPWLHTAQEIETAEKAIAGKGIHLAPVANLVDRIWEDRPAPPAGPVMDHPVALAGESSPDKRARIAKIVHDGGQTSAVLTLPDSISWLLNIRGSDIPRNPVVQAFAILQADGRVQVFIHPDKVARLGPDPGIEIHAPESFEQALRALRGPVRVDKATAPLAVSRTLKDEGIEVAWGEDPCILPKARKNDVELRATAEAHLRDGAAMVEFLAWLDREAPKGKLTEIDVVKSLEGFRRATNALHDISFDTICGAGPNGAIVHYRVTEGTNRKVAPGELLLVDSGGQYVDGTTDVTRTVAVGAATEEQRACFTRVLQGMIAISRARWPKGLAGRDLDALARAPLWMAGMDYDHGTGHGVGVFLSVHEGPQRLSRISEVPLEPGMILSNEPGYYREGAFGIRIENLVVVREAGKIADDRDQLCFETLTYVPIDRRLIDAGLLAPGERSWINRYHAEVRDRIAPRVSASARSWLETATRPI
jgi:Xaa-Pro aminopeptidase